MPVAAMNPCSWKLRPDDGSQPQWASHGLPPQDDLPGQRRVRDLGPGGLAGSGQGRHVEESRPRFSGGAHLFLYGVLTSRPARGRTAAARLLSQCYPHLTFRKGTIMIPQ